MEALKDKLESSFLVFENELNGEGEGPIHTRRREAFERFVKSGFPTKRDEEWKYTNLKPVLKPDFRVFVNDENTVDFSSIKRFFLNEV